jgi:hypothetical protein
MNAKQMRIWLCWQELLKDLMKRRQPSGGDDRVGGQPLDGGVSFVPDDPDDPDGDGTFTFYNRDGVTTFESQEEMLAATRRGDLEPYCGWDPDTGLYHWVQARLAPPLPPGHPDHQA